MWTHSYKNATTVTSMQNNPLLIKKSVANGKCRLPRRKSAVQFQIQLHVTALLSEMKVSGDYSWKSCKHRDTD